MESQSEPKGHSCFSIVPRSSSEMRGCWRSSQLLPTVGACPDQWKSVDARGRRGVFQALSNTRKAQPEAESQTTVIQTSPSSSLQNNPHHPLDPQSRLAGHLDRPTPQPQSPLVHFRLHTSTGARRRFVSSADDFSTGPWSSEPEPPLLVSNRNGGEPPYCLSKPSFWTRARTRWS